MSWPTIVLLQIVVSSFMTLFTRRIAITTKHVYFGLGILLYGGVFIVGALLSIVANQGTPTPPQGIAWFYVLLEGLCIPASWYFQYRLIGYLGAGNAVIVGVINMIGAALMGIFFLHDPLSITFILGSLLVISSAAVALRIQPDSKHHEPASINTKIIAVLASALFFSLGMFFEKQAIGSIGVWNYAFYGWGMQFVFAIIYFLIFGLKERALINKSLIIKGLTLGFITSIAGALYIYALSKGSLSHTIIALNGKIALTMVLAMLFLNERNAMKRRLLAFGLSVVGITLVVW